MYQKGSELNADFPTPFPLPRHSTIQKCLSVGRNGDGGCHWWHMAGLKSSKIMCLKLRFNVFTDGEMQIFRGLAFQIILLSSVTERTY